MPSTSTSVGIRGEVELRPEYLAWRESTKGLGGVARLIQDHGPLGRAEAEDLHRALGELLGIGGRGGARTKERFVRCPKKKAATCPTCQATPGHGPYLLRKAGGKWVKVEETSEQRKARRIRALAELQKVETEHALVLLGTIQQEAEDDGLLHGAAAEAARAEVLRHVVG